MSKDELKQYIAKNLIHIIIAALLAVLSFTATYFCHKAMSNEARIWELEHKNPTVEQRIADLDRRITEVKTDLSRQMQQQYEHLRDLIQETRP